MRPIVLVQEKTSIYFALELASLREISYVLDACAQCQAAVRTYRETTLSCFCLVHSHGY